MDASVGEHEEDIGRVECVILRGNENNSNEQGEGEGEREREGEAKRERVGEGEGDEYQLAKKRGIEEEGLECNEDEVGMG